MNDLSTFMPHGMCFLWHRDVLALHVIADLLIALSYFCIPVVVVMFVRRRPVLWRVGLLFATFIISCGITHLGDVWTIWHPDYWLTGALKALTAIASLATVAALLPLMPYGRMLRRLGDLDRANEELSARYRLIVEGSNDGIWLFDLAGRTTFANGRVCALLGYASADLIGAPFASFVHLQTGSAERERIIRRNRQPAPDSDSERLDVCFARKDGTPVWTEVHVSALCDADGRSVGAVATLADRTERRRYRRALHESERQYEMLAQAMPHGVFTADATGAVTYCNRAWCVYSGLTQAESRGDGWLSALHPDEAARAHAAWRRAVAAGEPFEARHRMRRAADGMYRWFVLRATPVSDEHETIVKWIGSTADIHDFALATETRDVLDALGHIVSIRADDGHVDYVSPSLALAVAPATPAADWLEYVHPGDRATLAARGPADGDVPFAIAQREIRLRCGGDVYRWFLARTVALSDDGGRGRRRVDTLTDIDDLKGTQAAIARSDARYRALIEAMPQMVWIGDRNLRVTYVNGRWLDYTGLTFEPNMPSKTMSITHPDDLDVVRSAHEAERAGRDIDCELRLRRHDGIYRWHLMRTVPLGDRNDVATTWVATATDIEERKVAELALASSAAELDYRAHHDPLTNLPNRTRLTDRLDALIADAVRDGTEIVVMYLDLDHFKAINDTFGHKAGDDLLVEVARRITTALRSNDTASRFGGDEFVMVCRTDSEHVALVAERIQAALAVSLVIDGNRISVGSSIGISVFPSDGTSSAALIANADAALYVAKQSGRNAWRRFSATQSAPPSAPAAQLDA